MTREGVDLGVLEVVTYLPLLGCLNRRISRRATEISDVREKNSMLETKTTCLIRKIIEWY
jgi:hypothetical protein